MKNNNINYLSIILITIFLLSPVLSNYSVGEKISLGDFFVILVLIVSIIKFKSLNIISLYGCISILIISIVDFILYLNYYYDGIMVMMRMSFYIFSYFIISSLTISKDQQIKIINYYIILCKIFALILIIQIFYYYLFDKIIFVIDTPLNIEKSSLLTLDIATQGFRSGGVFKEPSYFSIFIAPALFYAYILKRWRLYIFLSFAVILSTSALGFIFILLPLMDLIYSKISIKLFPALLAIFVIFVLAATDVIPIFPDRVIETLKGGGSLNARVIEPFTTIFIESEVFFGPNFGVLRDLSSPDYSSYLWFNSFTYIIIVLDLFSVIPVILIFINSEKKSIFFVAALLFATNSLSSPYFLVFLILLKLINEQSNVKFQSQKNPTTNLGG